MDVDEFTAPAETTTEVVQDTTQEITGDAAMEAAWAKMNPHEGVERGEDGKFKSEDGETEPEAELEGAATEGEDDKGNSAVTDIPLPANLHGLEEDWATLPKAVQEKLSERVAELHARMSDMGRQSSQAKPLMEAANEFAEYFNGNIKGQDGEPVTPATAVKYLFNIQREMDRDAPKTLMNIIDTYGARDKIAAMLGVQAAPVDNTNRELLSKIDRLESIIASANDPSRVEKVIDAREAKSETSRLLSSEPLVKDIPEARLVFFIQEGWEKLGETATRESVLKYAVKAATEADPALRAKTEAAVKAAQVNTQKAEAAKRANGVNVTSTSTGKNRPMTDDQLMEAEWAKLQATN